MNDNGQYFEAIISVNKMEWRGLLTSASNIEKIKTAGNYTLLHQAAHYNNYDATYFLINDCNWSNLNILDEHAKTPLMVAANYGSTEIAKLLIDKGADFTIRDFEGRSALYYACSTANIELIKHLLVKGADPNEEFSNGETALMVTIKNPRGIKMNVQGIIDCLIEHGADINKPNDWGYTPIIYSIISSKPDIEITKYLIEKGANKNLEMQHGRSILGLIDDIENSEIRQQFKNLFSK